MKQTVMLVQSQIFFFFLFQKVPLQRAWKQLAAEHLLKALKVALVEVLRLVQGIAR